MIADDRDTCVDALRCLSVKLRRDSVCRESGCYLYPLCDRVQVQLAAWADERRGKEKV